MAPSVDNSEWLEWIAGLMGGVPRRTCAATFPPDRYYCLLDELPLHLLPQQARYLLSVVAGDRKKLVLNPECRLLPPKHPPEELEREREYLSAFAQQGTIAWVHDVQRQALLPFWLGPVLEQILRELRPNEPVPAIVSEHVLALLLGAGILIHTEKNGEPNLPELELIGAAKKSFSEKGYAILPELIHPFHVAALRRYFRYQIRSGRIRLGDQQSSLRYVVHNEPVARYFHHQIARTLSDVAGETLKPSYVYLASYLSGAELKKHIDREQCEFSITLCLDFSPEPSAASPWPIRLDTSDSTATVYQMLGDGLAYRGTRLPHYRDKLGPGQTSTSIFFHYVAADFDGPLT